MSDWDQEDDDWEDFGADKTAVKKEAEVPRDSTEIFEIIDYSCASPWERFIATIEETLRQWASHPAAERLELNISYERRNLKLIEIRPRPQIFSEGKKSQHQELSSSLDEFPLTAHVVRRWFGSQHFLLLQPFSSDDLLSSNDASLLLSALTMALQASKRLPKLPCFVPIGDPYAGSYIGYQPSSLSPTVTRFRSDRATEVPPLWTTLNGLLDLFSMKLVKLGPPSSSPLSSSSSSSPSPLRKHDDILISSRLTYEVAGWDAEMWWEGIMSEENKELPDHAYLWGTNADPIGILRIYAMWSHLPERSIVDNAVFSAFNPKNAPSWALQYRSEQALECFLASSMRSLVTAYRDCLEEVENNSNNNSSNNSRHRSPFSPSSSLSSSQQRRRRPSHDDDSALSIEDRVRAILDHEQPSHDWSERGMPKSCPSTSVVSLLARDAASLQDWDSIRSLWREFLRQLRVHWENGYRILSVPEGHPDWRFSIMLQKLQMLNLCIQKSNQIGKASAGVSSSSSSSSSSAAIVDEQKNDDGWDVQGDLDLDIDLDGKREEEEEEEEEQPTAVPTSSKFAVDKDEEQPSMGGFGGENLDLDLDLDINDLEVDEQKAENEEAEAVNEESESEEMNSAESGTDSDGDDEFYDVDDEEEQQQENDEPVDEPLSDSELQTSQSEAPASELIPEDEEKTVEAAPPQEEKKQVPAPLVDPSTLPPPVGRSHPLEGQFSVATGLQLYIPVTQDAAPQTEDMASQQQELLTALGASKAASSIRARLQSAQLMSDMQAFKASNPGCVLQDFVSWFSPRDLISDDSSEPSSPASPSVLSNSSSKLSARMSVMENNLWRDMWESAQPCAAEKQRSLFDHVREAELVLHHLETSVPNLFMHELVVAAFVSAYDTLAQSTPSRLPHVAELLQKFKSSIASIHLQKDVRALLRLCDDLERVEKAAAVALSLLHRFATSDEVVNALVRDQEAALHLSQDKEAILHCLSIIAGDRDLEDLDDDDMPPPIAKEFILQCQTSQARDEELSDAITAKHGWGDEEDLEGLESVEDEVSVPPKTTTAPPSHRMYALLSHSEIRVATSFSGSLL